MGSVAAVGLIAFGAVGSGAYHYAFPALTTPAQAADTAQQAPQPATGFADLVAKVRPAVISVRVKVQESGGRTTLNDRDGNNDPDGNNVTPSQPDSRMQDFFRNFRNFGFGEGSRPTPQPRTVTGLGSGFFITADGYAVTNNHVVDHATSVQVTTDDGKIYTAKVVGTDPKTDLALIKVDGKTDFAHVDFAERAPRIGEWVVAVGNPFGLGGTVTAGIVSASGRAVGQSPYDYIQIDAPINKGNSGGPTFDMDGKVIGINTAIFSPSGGSVGIGFDVPAATAKSVVAQLKDSGHVTRGYLGVRIQSITPDMADSLGLKEARGAIIDEPQAGSPAAKAGLEAGDVITALNGTPVKDSREVAREVGTMAPGSSLKLDVLRKGQQKTLTVTLAEMPNQQQASSDHHHQQQQQPSAHGPRLGLGLAPATEVAGAGDKGLVVVAVEPNSPAAQRDLKVGDVILEVAGKPVANVSDVRKAVNDAHTQGKHDVLMRVKSADATKFVAVPLTRG